MRTIPNRLILYGSCRPNQAQLEPIGKRRAANRGPNPRIFRKYANRPQRFDMPEKLTYGWVQIISPSITPREQNP